MEGNFSVHSIPENVELDHRMLGVCTLKWHGTVFTEFIILNVKLKEMCGGIQKFRNR